MPVEPPPSRFAIARPPDDHPDDLWAVGADLEPGTLLDAYRNGIFPMPTSDALAWWSPVERAVISLDGLRVSRSLDRSRRRFRVTVDTAFADVVAGCASTSRPGGWIDDEIADAYALLHRLGWAHSIEVWNEDGLCGGLYGVAIGGLFAAESKFHRRPDASKVALVELVDRLCAAGEPGRRVLDVQWLTPHLASLGARTISRGDYHRRLDDALRLPDGFGCA